VNPPGRSVVQLSAAKKPMTTRLSCASISCAASGRTRTAPLVYWLLPQTTAKAVAKAGYRAMMRGPPRRDPRPLDEDAGARRRAPAAGHCPGGEPLACHPPHHGEQAALGEIAQTLLELVEERPEAAALLRGRTFARTLH
jgi:hypothetical protein